MKIRMLTWISYCLTWWKSAPRSIFTDFDEFVKDGTTRMQWSDATVRRWKTFKEHLERFVAWRKMMDGEPARLSYIDLNEETLMAFVQFLSVECGFRNSTVAKEVNLLKWFLRWADQKGFIKVRDYEEFRPKMKSVRSTIVFLTTEELDRLYKLKIPTEVSQHAQMSLTRDIFCFCCFTSLRFSDAARLKASNIQGKRLIITTQKTNDSIAIDLNQFAREILERYAPVAGLNATIFPHIAMSTVNIHIKTLGNMCGIDAPLTRIWFSGRERHEETLPKWQCLSTHAARRTFICAALASGVNAETVMKWTGHSNYKAMKPYIDITDEDKARAMEKVFG